MPKQEEFGFMDSIPAKLPEVADTRSPLKKRRDRQLLKKSLRPVPERVADAGRDIERGQTNEKKSYLAAVRFDGIRYDFEFAARDAEEAMARARWFLMHEFLGSDADKVDRILALDGSQIELSEKDGRE